MSLKCCIATRDQVLATPLGTKEWLQQSPRGAYTAARTVHSTSILQLRFHIRRLSQTVQLMMEADGQAPDTPASRLQLVNPDLLRPTVVTSIRDAIKGFQNINTGYQGDMRVTTLITWDNNSHDLATHVSALPTAFKQPVKVQVNGAPRQNAAAKDSEWCRQRADLEATQPPDVNEILLVDAKGGVLEGLTSNFFAISKGQVLTAKEGVLAGTVRDMVIQVCEKEGIPLQLLPPNLADVAAWDDAFITSTSRLVLPVDHLSVPGTEPMVSKQFPRGDLVCRIQELVAWEVEACSEPLELS